MRFWSFQIHGDEELATNSNEKMIDVHKTVCCLIKQYLKKLFFVYTFNAQQEL